MRAVVITEPGDPDVLQVADRPARERRRRRGQDRGQGRGGQPDRHRAARARRRRLPAPWVPGMDAAGVVESVGPEVERLSVGER